MKHAITQLSESRFNKVWSAKLPAMTVNEKEVRL